MSDRRTQPTVLVLVVIAVTVVVTLAAIALRDVGDEPTASASPSAPLAPSASPSAGATAEPSISARPSIGSGVGVDWSTVATFPGASVHDVTAGGPGWVAVGAAGEVGCEVCPGLSEYSGRIWASTDGRSWEEVAVPDAEGSIVSRVAAGPDGIVAIRTRDGDPAPDVELGVQQVLVSSDGLTWEPVFGTPFEEPFTSIADLVGGSRLLAVGQVASPDAPGFPAIWTSTDGRSWEEVHRSVQAGSVIGVTEGGLGWAAVGLLEHPATGDRQSIPFPAYWESPDGMTWSQADLPLPDTAGGGVAQAVLNSVAGLLAVGSGEYPPPEAPGPVIGFAGWQATDADWEPAPLTEDFLEDIGGGFLLYQSADRVFAIGSGCRCGAGLPGRWWTTTDGRSWVQHAETPPILHTVIPFGDGLLAVGIEDGNGAIFLSE